MKYRTLFFSDIHLGIADSQAQKFLDFIRENEFEHIYAVGDIIDFWALRRKPKHWKQSHNDVIQKLLRRHRKGSTITYIWGNHDDFMEQFEGYSFGGIDIRRSAVHETVAGKKYLVMHGHELDVVTKYARWVSIVGDVGYAWLLWANKHFNWLRSILGFRYWSLSAYVKSKVKNAVNFIGDYEHGIVEYAREAGTDGVICGHIHHAASSIMDGIHYVNTGDWVESVTCVVEQYDGKLVLLAEKEGKMLPFIGE